MIRKVNQIIKDLKILAAKIKLLNQPGNYLIKAASKEYYEGKIDMTGRKTAYFVLNWRRCFYSTNNLNHALINI
jgi:ribonuclease R